MAADSLAGILAAQGRTGEVQTARRVLSLFVLRFCARPLAGPPVGRTDSAIAPSPQASADLNHPPGNFRSTSLPRQVPASLNRSLAPFKTPFPRETVVSNNVRVLPISKTMPHPGNRMAVVPLAFHPLPCQSAFSGRNWACPSSSTSRAKRSPSL